jgi:hypothetical protein
MHAHAAVAIGRSQAIEHDLRFSDGICALRGGSCSKPVAVDKWASANAFTHGIHAIASETQFTNVSIAAAIQSIESTGFDFSS